MWQTSGRPHQLQAPAIPQQKPLSKSPGRRRPVAASQAKATPWDQAGRGTERVNMCQHACCSACSGWLESCDSLHQLLDYIYIYIYICIYICICICIYIYIYIHIYIRSLELQAGRCNPKQILKL